MTDIKSYEMIFQWQCFCTPCYVATKKVTVTDNECDSVEMFDKDSQACSDIFSLENILTCDSYKTIKELFFWIYDFIFNDETGDIDITYHETMGYPMTGFIDRIEFAIDDEISWTITNFTVLSFFFIFLFVLINVTFASYSCPFYKHFF